MSGLGALATCQTSQGGGGVTFSVPQTPPATEAAGNALGCRAEVSPVAVVAMGHGLMASGLNSAHSSLLTELHLISTKFGHYTGNQACKGKDSGSPSDTGTIWQAFPTVIDVHCHGCSRIDHAALSYPRGWQEKDKPVSRNFPQPLDHIGPCYVPL